MAFTREHARIAADMLTEDQRDVLLWLCQPTGTRVGVGEDVVLELEGMGFVRRDTNLMDGQPVLILTANGKKVAEAAQ
jgi:hypothetical protein